jgi:hypothetical protein
MSYLSRCPIHPSRRKPLEALLSNQLEDDPSDFQTFCDVGLDEDLLENLGFACLA